MSLFAAYLICLGYLVDPHATRNAPESYPEGFGNCATVVPVWEARSAIANKEAHTAQVERDRVKVDAAALELITDAAKP